MDIITITDIKELKALAYDQMATIEQTQNNLRLINRRIAEVGKELSEAGSAEKE